jgi:multidrug efflux system membrane fusion protein
MSIRRLMIYGVVAVALVAGVAYVVMRPADQSQQRAGGPGGRFRANPDVPVPTLASAARTADVPVYLDGVGTVRALNTVTVRSQVDGKLMRINFTEGQDVERGYVLAEIDDTLYKAQFDQAVAKKAQDEAQLENAKRDLERYIRLAATNALATQQADTQKSLVAQFEALVKADQAAIDNMQGTLQYTKVTAPIAGRTGIRQVDAGNIVHASDSTGLVTITQLRPISLIFTLPQQQLQQVNAAMAKNPLTVEVFGSDNKTVADTGKLLVVDNQVDQSTGTVKLKAEFPNANLQLWPGQFVNVRLLVDTLKNAVVVPTAAIQRGPNGLFVFAVKDDNTVTMKQIAISQQDETQTVVTSGVQSGERVATTSFNQLTDGGKVTIGTGEPGVAPAVAPNSGNRQRRQGSPAGGAAGSTGDAQSNERQGTPAGNQRRSEREGSSRTP